MTTLILGPILRHVTETTATIWVETSDRCNVSVLGSTAPTFTVEGHHFALVIVEGLSPASTTEYDVTIGDEVVWPLPDDPFPAPTIRTLGATSQRVLFGSCRAAAPHEPPYSLELDHDPRGRGVDSLRAHGLRMLHGEIAAWPTLLVLLGDQIYADDPSPEVRRRLWHRRGHRRSRHGVGKPTAIPDDVVGDFEQYTWLYHESWTSDVERWMMSVVPSTMIFDDHDVIDDWNISERWVADIRAESWWQDHIIGGMMSYWIYQHLGNQSPEHIASEGILAELLAAEDGSDTLREWARASERFTPVPGGYHFSYRRDLGDVRLIVIDNRNGRDLNPTARKLVGDDEWAWVSESALEPCRHLLIACSLPMLVPGGLHDLQYWNEAVCAGKWGKWMSRLGERVRRAIDLEDWSAFDKSFRQLSDLLATVGTPSESRDAPETITLLAGDIHFAYTADATFPDRPGVTSRICQIVSSPIRNALSTRERRVIRFALSRVGRSIGRGLRRSIRGDTTPLVWELDNGPYFANNIGMLTLTDGGEPPHLVIEHAEPDDDGRPVLDVVMERSL
ncbi:MAG TPA: hypothetical protein VMM60_06790 [Ilumatobacter sp.]|nr:hypothetical protein [Ilumatobacter sp.]